MDSWGINWWIIPKAGEIEYNLGDGSYIIMMSKLDPWYFVPLINNISTLNDILILKSALEAGNYIEVIRANAHTKAVLGTSFNVLARIMGIVSVIDPTEATGLVEIALKYEPESADLIADITIGGTEPLDRSKENAIKWVLDIIDNNYDAFAKWAKKYGVKHGKKAVEKGIENLTLVLDVAGAGGDIVQLLTLVMDSFLAEQDVVFTIVQSKGNAEIIESKPPTEPTISDEVRCISGQNYSYQVLSTDPENDQLKYTIHYGDGASDESPFVPSCTSFTFEHQWRTGSYQIFALAQDANGAISAMTTPLKVTATPAEDFIETFENYPYGDLLDDNIWRVNYQEPSKVMISTVAYESFRAAKFVDYDPDIGDQSAKFASLYTTLDNNLQTFETRIRVDNAEDAFGIRAWETLGYWQTIAYYVIVDASSIKWVKGAQDMNDPNDFIFIKTIEPGKWY